MKLHQIGILSAGMLALGACTTAELEAISQGLAQGMAEASYNMNYGPGYGYGSPYGTTYGTSYGQFIGYNQCSYTGSLYSCDTNGDGYVDMFGDSDSGSYTSSNLKVNGKGEGFTRNTDTGEWERNRAYDTDDRDDHNHRRHRRDDD